MNWQKESVNLQLDQEVTPSQDQREQRTEENGQRLRETRDTVEDTNIRIEGVLGEEKEKGG